MNIPTEKLIETLADLRGQAVEVIKGELRNENPHTMNQLFTLACAFKAVA